MFCKFISFFQLFNSRVILYEYNIDRFHPKIGSDDKMQAYLLYRMSMSKYIKCNKVSSKP